MSSVTRFLRQVPTGVGLVNPSSLISNALDFVPASGNYVGNYPPGLMVPASETGLATVLSENNDVELPGFSVIRDMGKTVLCPYAATVGATPQNVAYFRQYQLLRVNPISATQGFLGGVNGSNFGVVGPSAATVPGTSTYATFYLPTVVAGVLGSPSTLADVNVNAGLQM